MSSLITWKKLQITKRTVISFSAVMELITAEDERAEYIDDDSDSESEAEARRSWRR